MNEKVSQIVKTALERCGNEYAKSLECALEIIKSDSQLIDEALTEFISARIDDVIRGQYSQQRAGSWNAAPMSDSKYRGMVEQARASILDMPIHNGTKLRDATLPDVKKGNYILNSRLACKDRNPPTRREGHRSKDNALCL